MPQDYMYRLLSSLNDDSNNAIHLTYISVEKNTYLGSLEIVCVYDGTLFSLLVSCHRREHQIVDTTTETIPSASTIRKNWPNTLETRVENLTGQSDDPFHFPSSTATPLLSFNQASSLELTPLHSPMKTTISNLTKESDVQTLSPIQVAVLTLAPGSESNSDSHRGQVSFPYSEYSYQLSSNANNQSVVGRSSGQN